MGSTRALGTCPTKRRTVAKLGGLSRTALLTIPISLPSISILETRITSLLRLAAASMKRATRERIGRKYKVYHHSRVAHAQSANIRRCRAWCSQERLHLFGAP